MSIGKYEVCLPAEDKNETSCGGVLSPKEDEVNLYADEGGAFASGKGEGDASGRVS